MVKIKTCLDPDIIDMYRKDKLGYRLSRRLSPVFNTRVSVPRSAKRFLAASLAALVLATGGVTLAKNIELPNTRHLASKVMSLLPDIQTAGTAFASSRDTPPETYVGTQTQMPLDVFTSATGQEDAGINEHAREAMKLTGVSAQYLMRVTHLESSGGLFAKNESPTSTSEGPAGFTDPTWLQTLHRHGERFGYGSAAGKIGVRHSGNKTIYYVTAPAYEEYIMDKLRHDPRCVTMMAAAHTVDNYYYLKHNLGAGVAITETDLYKAHFLGAVDAVRFHRELKSNPRQTTAEIFPTATQEIGNRNILGTMSHPKTIGELHDTLTRKMPPRPVSIRTPEL